MSEFWRQVWALPADAIPNPPPRKGTRPQARSVLIALALHADDRTGRSWVSRNSIASGLGLRRDRVDGCLDALAAAGLIADTGAQEGRAVVWHVLPGPEISTGRTTDGHTGVSVPTDTRRTHRRTPDGLTDGHTGLSRTEQNGTTPLPPNEAEPDQEHGSSPDGAGDGDREQHHEPDAARPDVDHDQEDTDMTLDDIVDKIAEHACNVRAGNGAGPANGKMIAAMRRKVDRDQIREWVDAGCATNRIIEAGAGRALGQTTAVPWSSAGLSPLEVRCRVCGNGKRAGANCPYTGSRAPAPNEPDCAIAHLGPGR